METYLIKASAILGIFLLTYQLLLRNETFFKLNRFFLLTGMVAALLLPLVTIREEIIIPVDLIRAQSDSPNQDYAGPGAGTGWEILLWAGYLMGALYFTGMVGKQIWSLLVLMRNPETERQKGFTLVRTDRIESPFSFFRYIFYNPKSHDRDELQVILEHEKAHARQLHSLDVLLGRATTILLWINPLAWWYQKSIQQNLEYLADSQAVRKLTSLKEYQYTLLKVSGNSLTPALVNSFYSSLIKKRIVMLQQNQSKTIHMLKYLLILPVLAAFLMAFNRETVYIPEASDTQEMFFTDVKTIEVTIDKETTDEELVDLKKKLAQDGVDFSYTAVRNDAGEIISLSFNISGKAENGNPFSGNYNSDSDEPIKPVLIHINSKGGVFFGEASTFEKFKTGTEVHLGPHSDTEMVWVTAKGGKSLHEISEGDHEVIEIRKVKGKEVIIMDGKEIKLEELQQDGDSKKIMIKMLGDGTDSEEEVILKQIKVKEGGDHEQIIIVGGDAHGDHTGTKKMKVHLTSDSDNEVNTVIINTDDTGGVNFSDSNALFYIDGKKASRKAVKDLDPDQIATINVWKGPKAVEKYGKKAADGVVEITTKKQ